MSEKVVPYNGVYHLPTPPLKLDGEPIPYLNKNHCSLPKVAPPVPVHECLPEAPRKRLHDS